MARARSRLLAAVEGLEAGETTLPLSGGWTLCDVLSHIAGWATWDVQTINAIRQGEQPDLSAIEDVDAFNAKLVAKRAEWSLSRILAEMESTQIAMQALLTGISNQELFESVVFQGPYWGNLAEWLQVVWQHEEEHAAQIERWPEQPG
jgi:hypothetical protein